jgi:polyisoprenoid-binding protein YceI
MTVRNDQQLETLDQGRRHSLDSMNVLRYFVILAAAILIVLQLRIAEAVPLGEGEPDLIELDSQQSKVNFVLRGNLHDTNGRFALKSGTIGINPNNGNATGQIVIDGSSEDSSEYLRDAITRSAILDVKHYPEIVFIPQRVEGDRDPDGDFYGRITGLMELRGAMHEIGTEFHGHLDGDKLTAQCTFLVPYVEWGVESPNVLTSREIIQSTAGDNSVNNGLFSVFAYMLPVLRKIPPNLFHVSDLIEVTIEAGGSVQWAPVAHAQQVNLIVPRR